MRLRTLFGMLALVSLAAIAMVVFLLPDPPELRQASGGSPAAAGLARGGSGADQARPGEDPETGTGAPGGAGGRAGAPALSPIGWPSTPVEVRVREEDGGAAAEVAVRLDSVPGPRLEGLAVADERGVHLEGRSDAEGTLRFDAVPAGSYVLVAESPDRRAIRRPVVVAVDRGEFEVVLPRDASLRDLVVRVLDPEGTPVPAARVRVFGGVVGSSAPAVGEEPALEGETGGDGRVRFPDTAFEGGAILATAADGRTGLARFWVAGSVNGGIARGELAVTLSGVADLEGALLGLQEDRFENARVVAYSLDDEHPYRLTHGIAVSTSAAGGRYRFEDLPAGSWTLSLADPGGARLVLPALRLGDLELPDSLDPIEVLVVPGVTTSLDLKVAEGGSIEGLVLTEKGAPVASALVRATFAPEYPDFPDGFVLHGVHVWRFDRGARAAGVHPLTHPSTRTDSGGRYQLAGLPPGKHRLEVLAAGLAFDRREGVEVDDGRRTNLEHVLPAAGAIHGVEPRSGFLGIALEGRDLPLAIAVLPPDGSFTFAGLAPGSYVLLQCHADESAPLVPLATVEVQAGRTTWVDLARAERRVRFLGRVLDARGPVAGLRVRVHPETFVTDRAGRFEMRSAFPLAGRVSVQVRQDPVVTWYSFEGMSPEATSFEKDFVLGNARLSVRTVDGAGAPVPARLEISTSGLVEPPADVETLRFEPVFVDEGGERVVTGLFAGEYEVLARFENGAERQETVSVDDAAELVLRMPPSGDLRVRVLAPAGEPAPGRWVSIHAAPDHPASTPDAAPGRLLRWSETDLDGHAAFPGLPAGTLLVQVRARRGETPGLDSLLAEERVRVAPGEARELRITLRSP